MNKVIIAGVGDETVEVELWGLDNQFIESLFELIWERLRKPSLITFHLLFINLLLLAKLRNMRNPLKVFGKITDLSVKTYRTQQINV